MSRDLRPTQVAHEEVTQPALEPAGRPDADVDARVAALESDLAAVQRELEQVRDEAKKTQSQLASQLSAVQKERTSLLSDLEDARSQAGGASDRVHALESNLAAAQRELEEVRDEAKKSWLDLSSDLVNQQAEEEIVSSWEPAAQHEVPTLPDVTLEEVRTAVFASEAEREILERALSGITAGSEEARMEAVEALGTIHHELSVRAVANRLLREPSAQVRAGCVGVLTSLEMKEALPAVEYALTDKVACVRLTAVQGVYRLAGAEAAAALINAFSDENENVRRRAVVLTAWLGQKDLAVELRVLLDDPSASVRKAAVEAISNLRSPQAISYLHRCLDDPDESIRNAAQKAIEGTGLGDTFTADGTFRRRSDRWSM